MRPCGCFSTGPHRKECEIGKPNTAPPLAELKRQWHTRPIETGTWRIEWPVPYGWRAKRSTPVSAS